MSKKISILTQERFQSRLTISAGADNQLVQTVHSIIERVKAEKDQALYALAQEFGDVVLETLQLNEAAVHEAIQKVSLETRTILETAAANIRAFAEGVMQCVKPLTLERMGYQVGLDFKPAESVGCYVPSGRYPLPSTALMTAITAQVAGVKHLAITSPVLKPEIVYAGHIAGVKDFYQVGGAQAIAALAFGTESIAPVDMVVGPGNAYVTEAKRQLQGIIGIDMLAGPSEVAIVADATSNPKWLALDLLSQAEHDPDARAYLLTADAKLAELVAQEIQLALEDWPADHFLQTSMGDSCIVLMPSLEACVEAANAIAPEHLHLSVADPLTLKPLLKNYGALFMGHQATVPFGDYMAGPNHTLPTGRSARFCSGLSPLTFLRSQSWFLPDGDIRPLAKSTAAFAKLEGLMGHAKAAEARI